MGALTMLNESGDTTVAWTSDRDEEMARIIEKKMAAGVTFFVIEDRGLRTKAESASDAMRTRQLAIPDEDLLKFVEEGKGEALPTPKAKITGSRRSKNAKEVATRHSVGVRQRVGG